MRRFATSDSVTSPKRTGKFCFSTPARRATLKSHLLRLASTLSFSSQQTRWCIIITITITWISSVNWTSRRSMERWELKFRLTVRIVREKSKINAPCVWLLHGVSEEVSSRAVNCLFFHHSQVPLQLEPNSFSGRFLPRQCNRDMR